MDETFGTFCMNMKSRENRADVSTNDRLVLATKLPMRDQRIQQGWMYCSHVHPDSPVICMVLILDGNSLNSAHA